MGKLTYLWRIASDCPDGWIAVSDKKTVDAAIFRKTLPFEGAQPIQFAIRRTKSELQSQNYLPNSAMLPLVSAAMGKRMQELTGGAIQCVSAVIICDDGELNASLINPLKAITGVDWNGSKALYIPGTKQVMKFTQLQLLPEVLNDLNIARLDEFRPFILVSECVKNLFADSKLCEFVLPDRVCP